VSNAAIGIGPDVLEVVHDGMYFINGLSHVPFPSMIGGFEVTKSVDRICRGDARQLCSNATIFMVRLNGNDAIRIKVASNMLHVDVKGSHENFHGSVGLMGTYPALHHGKIARDGETFIRDSEEFGQEWQVRAFERKMFKDERFPQYPILCVPPAKITNQDRSLRFGSETDSHREGAEQACAHVQGPEWEFCVLDVMATGDYGMAASIYGDNW